MTKDELKAIEEISKLASDGKQALCVGNNESILQAYTKAVEVIERQRTALDMIEELTDEIIDKNR